MNQIESIQKSALFSDRNFLILIGMLLLFVTAIGARRKPAGRGTGRYASATEILTHLGNWARLPLSAVAVALIYTGLLSMVLAWRYWEEGTLMDRGRLGMIACLVLILAILIYWILLEAVLSKFETNRFLLGGKWFFAIPLSLREKDRFEHIRVQGRAGTGKTDGFMFPQLIEDASGSCSAVVLDVKSPEAFHALAGAWCAKGKKVILFDPYHPDCPGFNPLSSGTGRALDQIEETVYGKQNNNAENASRWFVIQERRLFRWMCELILTYQDPCQRSLPMVYELANRGVPALEAAVTYCGRKDIQEKMMPLFQHKQRLQDVLSGILNTLDLFADPKLSAAFSRADLDLDLLFREPTLLILASPFSNPKARLATAILLRAIMLKVYERPVRTAKDGPPLFFYLDEFYALHFPDLADFANTARSARAGVVTFLQAEEQLYRYERHEIASIATNTKTQIYLQGCDMPTCKRLSEQMGKRLIEEKRTGRSWGRRATITTAYVERPLMEPSEIYHLEPDKPLVFIGGMRPFQIKRVSSYRTRRFKRRRGLPAAAYRPSLEPLTPPAYRDLDLPPGGAPPSPTMPTAPGPMGDDVIGWELT